jgi:hypothetical protein
MSIELIQSLNIPVIFFKNREKLPAVLPFALDCRLIGSVVVM